MLTLLKDGSLIAVLLPFVGSGVTADNETGNARLSSADADFVKEAAQGGTMEVQLGAFGVLSRNECSDRTFGGAVA